MTSELTNRILGDRYLLQQQIGGGGMGSVFRALDLHNQRQEVAIKVLHAPMMAGRGDSQADLRRRFVEEIRISSLLGQHPRIVKVLDHGQEGENVYLVMEYLRGQDLAKWMQSKGALPVRQVLRLALQACEGFYYAHTFQTKLGEREIRGVIHRDIKPSNLFIEQSFQEGKLTTQLKILDFGVAKTLADQTLSLGTQKGGGFIGTARYASPEQIRGKSLDARSDIYSLGVVIYEMLTGSMPFQLETDSLHSWIHAHCYEPPLSINPERTAQPIPPYLVEVVMDCLKKNPEERPQTMQELGERLLKAYNQTIPTQLSPSQASTEILTPGSPVPPHRPTRPPSPSNAPKLPLPPLGRTGSGAGEFEDIRDEDLDLIEDEPAALPGAPYYIAYRAPVPPEAPAPPWPETEILASQPQEQSPSRDSTPTPAEGAALPVAPPPETLPIPAPSPAQPLPAPQPTAVFHSFSNSSLKWMVAGGSLFLLLLAALFLWPPSTVLDPEDQPEPTPTPVVPPSPSPAATPTPEVTPTPTPTPTPEVTPTPTPQPTPTSTPTPQATPTPTPRVTPTPPPPPPAPPPTPTPLAVYYQRLEQLTNEAVAYRDCQPALDLMNRILQDYPDQQAQLDEYRRQLLPRCASPSPTPVATPSPTPTPRLLPSLTPLIPPSPRFPTPQLPTPQFPTPEPPTPAAEVVLSGEWVYEGGSFAWQGSTCRVNAASGVQETVSISHSGEQVRVTSPSFQERSGQFKDGQFSVTGRAGGVGTPNITWSGTVSPDGRSIRGTATCGKASFPITLTRQS